jgi:L-cysteine/cystine lyase
MDQHKVGSESEAEQEKIAAIRAELPAVQANHYFNTGTNGPFPQRSYEALLQYASLELTDGRIAAATFPRMRETGDQARAQMAAILGCDPLEIALTHNTTEGMNIALMGLDWQRGDEVVTATTEHPGGLYPAYLVKQRYGVKLRMTDIGLPHVDPVAALERALTPRTKAVVLSHVCWATGMVLPIHEMAALAHQYGALFICDAAQSCGMVPSNVYDLGVDAYACSGQKWLCGPDGSGALFIRKDRLSEIQPTYFGYFGVKPGMSTTEGYFVPNDGARRYEAASHYYPAVKALATSLTWLNEEIGLEWMYQRIATLGQYCYQALESVPGVTILTPREPMAGLVHFTLEGVAPADLTSKLREQGILIRETPSPAANRVSLGFYNTQEEIDHLIEAVAGLRAD